MGDTFEETACQAGFGYDKCLTYAYSSTAGGCTTTYATGSCSYAEADCSYYKSAWASYDGFECNDCTTDNCNTKDHKKTQSSSGTCMPYSYMSVITLLLGAAVLTW